MFGLIVSMAILMWFGSMVADLINRFPSLSYVGAAVIAWTGGIGSMIGRPAILRRRQWASIEPMFSRNAFSCINAAAC